MDILEETANAQRIGLLGTIEFLATQARKAALLRRYTEVEDCLAAILTTYELYGQLMHVWPVDWVNELTDQPQGPESAETPGA